MLESLGADPDERTDGLDGYVVKLAIFEGPLDLLLHLIRQNEVDITDIPIQRIAEQYLETIELMQELNLDIAAEYLVMAATLALIKSRMLLPSDEDEEEEGVDPRAELVQRLLEYQRFKEAAETLSRRRLAGRLERGGAGPGEDPRERARDRGGALRARRGLQGRARQREGGEFKHEVETESVTVRDRMMVVMDLLEENETIEFMRIFERPGNPGACLRPVLVASFLAILELARLSALRIYQGLSERGTPEGAIRVRRSQIDNDSPEWRERITETM